MQLFDTHCHIQEAAYGRLTPGPLWRREGAQTAEVMVNAAASAGVTRMICVGTTVADSARAIDFVQTQSSCWASVGLHPHEAKEGRAALANLATLLRSAKKAVAIGECGLDYFYNHSNKKEQEIALRAQVELALEHGLPLIFHVREAFSDFWPIFDSYPKLRGVLHSFTDTQAQLDQALARGLYIGVNGIATFTKVAAQQAMYKAIPLEALLLETDAPFLTPSPYRGKLNEPAHVKTVAESLATNRGESLQKLAETTTHNAQTLFKT